MPQKPKMSESPLVDIVKEKEMLEYMLNFALIHEDVYQSIRESFLYWVLTVEPIKEKYEEKLIQRYPPEFDHEYIPELFEFVLDEFGTEIAYEEISYSDVPFEIKKKAALMLRHIIFTIMYDEFYRDPEDIVKECEEVIADEADESSNEGNEEN